MSFEDRLIVGRPLGDDHPTLGCFVSPEELADELALAALTAAAQSLGIDVTTHGVFGIRTVYPVHGGASITRHLAVLDWDDAVIDYTLCAEAGPVSPGRSATVELTAVTDDHRHRVIATAAIGNPDSHILAPHQDQPPRSGVASSSSAGPAPIGALLGQAAYPEHSLTRRTDGWYCACGTGPWTYVSAFMGHILFQQTAAPSAAA
jgi:hypothetical protein